jgi:hypothetical protein
MRSKAIVERVDGFVNLLPGATYDRPAKKFVRDGVFGMMESQSLVGTDIAPALSDGNREFKATYKRVIRRLGEVDLGPAMAQQQARALDEVRDDTIIAIDIGDVAKPFSNELECLDRVADGSDGHVIARMVRFSSWRAVFRRVALRLKKASDRLYNWFYRGADACAALCRKHRAAILAANRPILSRRRPPLEQMGLFSGEFDQ